MNERPSSRSAAPALYLKIYTAKSTSCAATNGAFPLSVHSSCTSSSLAFSKASANLFIRIALWAPDTFAQGPRSAFYAACTAKSTSFAPAAATDTIFLPVAGSKVSIVFPLAAFTHFPSMSS